VLHVCYRKSNVRSVRNGRTLQLTDKNIQHSFC